LCRALPGTRSTLAASAQVSRDHEITSCGATGNWRRAKTQPAAAAAAPRAVSDLVNGCLAGVRIRSYQGEGRMDARPFRLYRHTVVTTVATHAYMNTRYACCFQQSSLFAVRSYSVNVIALCCAYLFSRVRYTGTFTHSKMSKCRVFRASCHYSPALIALTSQSAAT